MPHRGEYRTIQRFEKLVFTWISDHTGPDSVVTLTFKECGPHETELRSKSNKYFFPILIIIFYDLE